jgi:hypothetical protein
MRDQPESRTGLAIRLKVFPLHEGERSEAEVERNARD